MRSVVSAKIGRWPTNHEASLPTASSGLPSDENATAWIGCVCTTALISGRARSTSEWMNTSLWRGQLPDTLSPSMFTVMMLSSVISSIPIQPGFIRNLLGSLVSRAEMWPQT